jgi:hypothetical protein
MWNFVFHFKGISMRKYCGECMGMRRKYKGLVKTV